MNSQNIADVTQEGKTRNKMKLIQKLIVKMNSYFKQRSTQHFQEVHLYSAPENEEQASGRKIPILYLSRTRTKKSV